MNATNTEMRYDAFISYRHSEVDKFVAEELHKQLESFKIPANIAKECKKKKISRIFRDKDELPITSNLADPIMNALRESEYLIVICSPRLKESIWCRREIENFIEMHGQEKILAVLVEGEPAESFPPELLYREKTVVNENGETAVIREPVEPLAADVRGKNKKEIKKLIKTERLRLLASMLQCNYDDLKQRHKERRMHKILAVAAVVGAVGIAFGTISTVMALKIQNQKEQIDKQYWAALENNARMSADNALELLQSGDRIGAMNMALQLLPEDLKKQSIPYTSEAYFALTDSLQPYATGDVLRPVFQIQENAEITEMQLSDDYNKVYVRTKYNLLTVWDIPNKKKCLEVDLKALGSYGFSGKDLTFIGEEGIAFLHANEVKVFGFEDGEVSKTISVQEIQYPHAIYSNSNGKYIAVAGDESVGIYNVETEELHCFYETPENLTVVMNECQFRGDNRLVLVFGSSSLSEETYDFTIQYVEVETGNILGEAVVPYGRVAQIDMSGQYLFVALNSDMEISLYGTPGDAQFYCYDIFTGEKIWQHQAEDEFVNGIVVPYEGYDCFLFESYGQITALDAITGEMIGRFTFGDTITQIFPLQTADTYQVFTREGRRVNFIPEKNLNAESVGSFVSASDNIKQIEWGNNFLAALPYSAKEIIVYEWYMDEGAKEVLEIDGSVDIVAVSADEKYSAITLYSQELVVIENETKEIVSQTFIDGYTDSLQFIDDNKIQRIYVDEVFVYDLQGNLLDQYEVSDDYVSVEGYSIDGKYIFCDDYKNLLAINAATKEVEGDLSIEQCQCDGTYSYMFSNAGDICVILDKTRSQCRIYDVSEGTLLNSIDINATYIENILFSEDDSYVYFVYEDGRVEQYVTDTMERKCEVTGLDSITEVIKEYTENGEKKIYFHSSEATYVLKEYDGQLKAEQKIAYLKGVMPDRGEYWISNSMSLFAFPIYTYEEMLGKAEQICYDNSLWNNN